LNEIKYDYADSKQHFYLQYHVAATENRHETTLQKTNDISSSGVPRVYPAWGQTQFKRSQPVRGSIKKETLRSDALLQLSNSKDKVFVPFPLKIYRLYCQKADKI